ncbi:NAD(P)/FAD-dependent oxidoreductase [Pseudomonas sp. gcc21]|uniref:flavin-containing monooxygenase n=1 Tax=Pseudomonas sp. gcc21 TaxID=2726989 RepID=UPI0014518F3A|nr:NAD(P)/FAD-dependent oxidoreductase [Pseudomonas sp. gcc21]QJD59000.1 NAD(P)/FAD-dependent oxidoreductase [Pseudomonas sp. gcc21]
MSAFATAQGADPHHESFDVVIVGAGISGIGSATMLREQHPNLSFLIIEALESYGGTWLIHKYPGARSDSDLFTFGYHFKPWTGKPIASRDQILQYLGEAIKEADLAPHIRYRQRVESADWSSADQCWTLQVSHQGDKARPIKAGFLWMCQGYYQHAQGYTPAWPGMERFKGEVIHPQQWPEAADMRDKRVVVIGSGATAATLIPALASDCRKVTMLQRTPTYFAAGRNADQLAEELRNLEIDPAWIHEIMRKKAVRDRAVLLRNANEAPDKLKHQLIEGVRACLPEGFDAERHFTPPYKPLQQRVAFVPEGDLFKAISDGKASMVTDHIECFDEQGIQLQSGERLDCDVVITATGFEMSVMGEIPFSVDGERVDFAATVGYRGILFTGVPNMAWVYGYGFYSWTLRVELIGNFVCRLLGHLQATGAKSVVPALRPEDSEMQLLPWVDTQTLNPGYLMRSLHRLPKRGDKPEWQHSQDYGYEKQMLPKVDFTDSIFSYHY